LRAIGIAYAAIVDGLLGRVADPSGRILRVYPDTPRVFVAELSAREGQPRLRFDLRRDKPRVAVSGFGREQLFIAEVLHGVIDGSVERQVIDFFTDRANETAGSPFVSQMSTSLVFERAQAAKTKAVLLSRKGASLGSDVPEDVRARVDELLAAGWVIIAPERPVDIAGARRYAWWQIDPHFGETIAVTDEGLNSSTAEGVVIRTENGTFVVRLRHGNQLYRYASQHPDVMSSWVRTATSNLGQSGVQVQWRGLAELWGYIL
jgi:hypothetical protein